MKKWEIINDLAQSIIEKIMVVENYKDRANNWYSHFEEVEKDIKKGREMLNELIKNLKED